MLKPIEDENKVLSLKAIARAENKILDQRTNI